MIEEGFMDEACHFFTLNKPDAFCLYVFVSQFARVCVPVRYLHIKKHFYFSVYISQIFTSFFSVLRL